MKTIEQIAAELQGYDPQALRAADVNAFLARLVEPVTETESVGLFEALDRVLAQDVISPISVPPHDNSAMDGFAFDAAMLRSDAPLTLKIIGTALAGKAWQGTVAAGECVKIMTGAIMPAGLDTVVPQEFVTFLPHPSPLPRAGEGAGAGDGAGVGAGHEAQATISIPPGLLQPGDNRRKLGEDLMAGRPALLKGTRLTPAACGLLASLGLATVPVFRRLKVAYFSTGDEILSLGELPREGAVYDSNRYTVFGLLTRLGIEVIDLGVVRDEPALLEAAFTQAAAQADAIITSGGVSVGEADHTKTMMKQLGDVAFWRIAMRPGRPMAVGRISGIKMASSQRERVTSSYQDDSDSPPTSAILFGLPGNPVAVMVTFLAFVRPALLRLMGNTSTPPPLLKAVCAEAIRKKPGRTEYQRGTVSTAPDGTLQVRTTGNQGSGVLSSMVQGNGLIVLHHGQGNVAVGDEVDVMMFDGVI
jgi:molybdopterin molybdotransferase